MSGVAALLSPFTFAADVCSALQVDVALAKSDEFRKAETSLNREQQQDPISSAEPGRLIRHFQESLDFGPRQKIHYAAGLPLWWDRKYALDCCRVLWALQRRVAKEGADRCETDISAARCIGPILLEVVKKRADKCRIQIHYSEFGWRLPQLLLSKLQQQTKSVPVRRYRVRADAALCDQPVREERLSSTARLSELIVNDSIVFRAVHKRHPGVRAWTISTNRCVRYGCARETLTGSVDCARHQHRCGTKRATFGPRTYVSDRASWGGFHCAICSSPAAQRISRKLLWGLLIGPRRSLIKKVGASALLRNAFLRALYAVSAFTVVG